MQLLPSCACGDHVEPRPISKKHESETGLISKRFLGCLGRGLNVVGSEFVLEKGVTLMARKVTVYSQPG